MADIIHFHRVSHRYEGVGDVLSDVTFTLAKGEMAFLTGSSGAGKSTLLRLIALLERPTRGQVMVNGQNIAGVRKRQIPEYRQQIGVVFQNFNLLYDRPVFDNVALPLVIRGISQNDIARRVRAALDAVGLLGKERVMPITLSGGEQQRVGIARAIIAKPRLLLADEPTGNLDPGMAREVMELFRRFNEVGVSVLVATHAVGLISQLPYRVIHLEKGQLITRQSPDSMENAVDIS